MMKGVAINPAAIMPIQNPHMITFNPLVTEDFKIGKVLEINNRLLDW
jgi:hypothetical protein